MKRSVVLLCLLAACEAPEPSVMPEPEPEVEVPGEPEPTPTVNPSREEALPFAIEPLADPAQRRVIDRFDSHTFWDAGVGGSQRVTLDYSPDRATVGRALRVAMPMSDSPLDWTKNHIAFGASLPEPEDWSKHPYLTFDVYSEEQPTIQPACLLVLRNSHGDEFWVSLILGWLLYQWDNIQMTFPLDGNDYDRAPVPPEILRDITYVELRIYHIGDGQFGPPLQALRFHVDNMRLSAVDAWDTFDGPALDWHAEGDSGTHGGVTHNVTYGSSAGALALHWNYAGNQPTAEVSTRLLSAQAPSSVPFAPIDLSGMRSLSAEVRGSDPGAGLRLKLFDGTREYISPPRSVGSRDSWQTLTWPLPGDEFDLSKVERVGFEVPDIPLRQQGVFYIDDLRANGGAAPFDAIIARPSRRETFLAWIPSASAAGKSITVRASTNGFPTSPSEGDDVCVTTASYCVHGDLTRGATYYYSLFAGDEQTPGAVRASQDFVVLGADSDHYEAAFDKENGALVYVYDRSTDAIVSYGSPATWKLIFADQSGAHEAPLASLSSDTFSPTSATRRFFHTDTSLNYTFDEDGRYLTMQLTLEDRADGFSMRAKIENETGEAIRTVVLPHDLAFPSEHVERVLLPIQEGLVLLKHFFTSGRSTNLARPPLFADVLALESTDGKLAVYAVQDSHYHEELITGHDPKEPVFQPNNLYLRGDRALSHMGFEQVTAVPSGKTWESVGLRFLVGKTLHEVAAAYRHDNGFDDHRRYPTLVEKLRPFGLFDRLAQSPIYVLECSKMVLWQKASWPTIPGLPSHHPDPVFTTVKNEWLPILPSPSVLHLTHWQYGRDFNSDPSQNHRIEDDHPDALPIWDRYGSDEELDALLDEVHARGSLTMPFTNWSVWNKVDPVTHELPALEATPVASRTVRGPSYPYLEYDGYMVKPWRPEVRAANEAMANTYRTTYPMDLLFVDMTGERSWRYVLADDDVTVSAAAYTQGVVDENRRLSAKIPLFTEGVFDRIADSIAGYNQTIRQKRWNGVLDHIGHEYVDWVPYPFAADVVHKNVAFYPHDLNTETWAAKSTSLYSYYMLMGYGLHVNATAHIGEDHYWIEVADAMSKAVTVKQFGQPLLDYRVLRPDYAHVESVWGDPKNALTVTANYDPLHERAAMYIGAYGIAPDGFFARSAKGDVLAGVFKQHFNGTELPAGDHWITVVQHNQYLEVRHPLGEPGSLAVPPPEGWTSAALSVVFTDGTEQSRGAVTVEDGAFRITTAHLDPTAQRWVRGYRLRRN